MQLLSSQPGHSVWCGDSLTDGLPEEVDCIITDPPYSERTHSGHNEASRRREPANAPRPSILGRPINYTCWSSNDVSRAVSSWSCRGWWVIITDHVLAPIWSEHLDARGLYVFAPIPFVSPGSRVRLAGDGPSTWVCWIVVARPRHEPYSKWGTLPGAYTFNPERMELVGGKPLALMKALVNDYSRPGDLVCDPCCGAGTTGRAAMDCGRRSLQIDLNPDHAAMAARRLSQQVLAV